MTREEYLAEILKYILTATQIGFSFGTSTFMGLLVGLITVALSMFSSVVDNMRQFGTIKAIGATTFDLARLLFVQAIVYGVVGSIIGLGMMAGLVQGIRNAQLTPILPTASIGITVVVDGGGVPAGLGAGAVAAAQARAGDGVPMSAPAVAVQLTGITKTYGTGALAFQALKGVDLTVPHGRVHDAGGPFGQREDHAALDSGLRAGAHHR